jgi:prophage regulatory protein
VPANSENKQLGLFEKLEPNPKPKADTPSKPLPLCTRCTEQYLSDHQVAARFGITKATVWRWHYKNPDFPRRIKLSPGTSRWKLSDLGLFEAKMQEACASSNLAKVEGRP